MTAQTTIAHADWFKRPETQAIFSCLNAGSFETRAVGGAVRNALLNEPVRDVDFATTAMPEDIIRLSQASGFMPVPTGLRHGTVTVVVGDVPFEVTTLRRDVETDGRHAVVAFGADWEADARRRDFTMNALYADRKGHVHDPLDGLGDVIARRVRFIGKATERIREDYLRILRFFRFSALYQSGPFDAEGIDAVIAERDGLPRLAAERVREEIFRLLLAPRAVEAMRIMDEAGLLLILLGGVVNVHRLKRLTELEDALGLVPDLTLRVAAATLFVDEDAARISTRLKLSSAQTAQLALLANTLPGRERWRLPLNLKPFLYRVGQHNALSALLLGWAESGAPVDARDWSDAFDIAKAWTHPDFPLRGSDLIGIGFEPGPALGKAMRAMEDDWIASLFTLSKAQLLNTLKPPPVVNGD